MRLVYSFDHDHGRPPTELKELLGGKGANLAELTSLLGLPVPPGFTITTDACCAYLHDGWPQGLSEQIAHQVRRLEGVMARRLGDGSDPLLVSVRSGAMLSMPGMMDTVLNLGLNDASVRGLAGRTNDARFAYDAYRRFISMYGRIVFGVDGAVFDAPLERAARRCNAQGAAELPADAHQELCAEHLQTVAAVTGHPFPEDPYDQLGGAVAAVFRSWNGARAVTYRTHERIPHDLGTAVNVQAMVFGNRDDRSGTGVGFTRDPVTGARGGYGDFLINAQGEDVVSGSRNTLPLATLGERFPSIYAELMAIFARLEAHFRDMCDVEFTIEQDTLWMLQSRIGKRTGRAALTMAVDMTKQEAWRISEQEAVCRISTEHLSQVLRPKDAGRPTQVIGHGLPASPGAATGTVVLSADDAAEAADRGERVILVRNETSPEDVHGMLAAEGILTTRGGLVSHAAVVARGWGKPAVVGAECVSISDSSITVADVMVRAGGQISIDGSSGRIALGEVEIKDAEPPVELGTILRWSDRIRDGRLPVRANVTDARAAAAARDAGADCLGVCTEPLLLAGDAQPIVRHVMLASTPEREEAAAQLGTAQRQAFASILESADGLPVALRLCDASWHQFAESTEEHALIKINPPPGDRTLPLAAFKPAIWTNQVRALVEAAAERVLAGGNPRVDLLVPSTSGLEELASVDLDLSEQGLFEGVDRSGVSGLVKATIERVRAINPDATFGRCDRHAGDPDSIDFCYEAGTSYLSCSPATVPIARLAAAQAVAHHGTGATA